MSAENFKIIFIGLLIFSTFVEIYLSFRQIKSVDSNRNNIPMNFRAIIQKKDHHKAASYTSAKSNLNIINLIFQAIFVYCLTIGGGINYFYEILNIYFKLNPNTFEVTLILLLLAISSFVDIPFNLYKTFKIDAKFGFNKMNLRLYLTDLLKQSAISMIFMIPLLYISLWIFSSLGDFWWVWLWLFISLFNVSMLIIYPLFIAPLFNKFKPLDDKKTVHEIEKLMKKCGFKSNGLYVMNGSIRSTHGNAYFTGFGKAKRIVFFDTLLERLNINEIKAVLAHELGHFAHNHVKKRIMIILFISLLGLFFLDYLKNQDWFYFGLGLNYQSDAMALIAFFIFTPLLMFFIKPILSLYSRENEYEADRYACKYSSANDLKDSLIKLYRDNAATLTPDPMYSAFYDSHPSAINRINALTTK
ncbi:MAG: M48 family metallopeptidase [Nitrosomonadales bacterium]